MKTLRVASLLVLVSSSLAACAADAFSNLAAAPNRYDVGGGWIVGSNYTPGFQFTSALSGALTGFQVAINDYRGTGAFTLDLYRDSGSDTFGTLLGSYAGTSTGVTYSQTSALTAVAASGPTLTTGSRYWLVASGTSIDQLGWNLNADLGSSLVYKNGTYESGFTAAFSVQVDPITSAVPGPAAALPFALMALRRRKRA